MTLRPFSAILLAALLTSCSMMQDNRSDCPSCYNPLHVVLRYDYNTQRADMYADHVRQATVYITDLDGRIVAKDQATATPGHQLPQAFNFEGLPEGDYRAYAVATTPPQGAETTTPIAIPDLQPGDNISALQPRIPRADSPEADASTIHYADARFAVPSLLPLDTLWLAHSRAPFHLTADSPTLDTLSLVRDTKNINIMLVQTANPTDNSHDRYDVTITDANGLLAPDNTVLPDQPLRYHPNAQWTTETLDTSTPEARADSPTTRADSPTTRADAPTVLARTAHYDLSCGRLISHDDASRNARLQIRNRDNGRLIVDLDLVHVLAMARNAYNTAYPTQEYLDREYDYYLDFVLMGNEWRYLTIRINILSWALRIQNETL